MKEEERRLGFGCAVALLATRTNVFFIKYLNDLPYETGAFKEQFSSHVHTLRALWHEARFKIGRRTHVGVLVLTMSRDYINIGGGVLSLQHFWKSEIIPKHKTYWKK